MGELHLEIYAEVSILASYNSYYQCLYRDYILSIAVLVLLANPKLHSGKLLLMKLSED